MGELERALLRWVSGELVDFRLAHVFDKAGSNGKEEVETVLRG